MKTARFLLACALISLVAACGGQGITAPDTAAPARPHFDIDPPSGDEGTSHDAGTGPSNCIIVIVVKADGTVTQQCQLNGSQMGSGG